METSSSSLIIIEMMEDSRREEERERERERERKIAPPTQYSDRRDVYARCFFSRCCLCVGRKLRRDEVEIARRIARSQGARKSTNYDAYRCWPAGWPQLLAMHGKTIAVDRHRHRSAKADVRRSMKLANFFGVV